MIQQVSQKAVAILMDVSESVVSKWLSKDRKPSFTSALAAGDLFQVDPGRLARADFGDLLEHERADAEQFRRVESEIELKRRERAKSEKVVPIQRHGKKKGGTKKA